MLKKNKKSKKSVFVITFLVLYTFVTCFVGAMDYAVPDKVTITGNKINQASISVNDVVDGSVVEARLFDVLPIKNVHLEVLEENTLIPCGDVFGVKFFTKGVIIVNLADIETKDGNISPAKKAGLKVGDIIESIDGREVNTVEDVSAVIESSHGKDMAIKYSRNGETLQSVLTPLLSLSDKKYKTGIWVRDSTAGIGTVTYYNPRTGEFAGLGHGICDVDTGLLMPLREGNIVDVEITDIIKGRRGSPGELKGEFDSLKKGSVSENSSHGIFGTLNTPPQIVSEELPVGSHDEVKTGKAYILCKLDDEQIQRYEIEITKINKDDDNKNFVIETNDKKLIEKTGGIVQGMSGSPIIQNGKLVGAVTHVLVSNPQKGYGIFIENMLK